VKTAFDTAKTYLDTLPGAVSGAGGHNTTLRAACWLVKCGLGDSEALDLLRGFNRRCDPPWTEKELAHKLADARRKVTDLLTFAQPSKPPVRLVWKVSRTIQPKPEALPQAPPAPPVAIPGDTNEARQPWITKAGDLVIPFGSPARFHWWKGGQQPSETRKELTK